MLSIKIKVRRGFASSDKMKKGAVLVTGSSRGIGKAIARKLSQLDGIQLGLTYHKNTKKAMELKKELETGGTSCKVYQCDLGSERSALKLASDFTNDFKDVIGLVNNAGIYKRNDYKDVSLEDWHATINVNLTAPFILTREIAPCMKEGGSIVNIASVLGRKGSGHGVDYTASKAGLIGMTRAFARELGPLSINVNCVAPGATDTDIIAGDTPKKRKERQKSIPLGRVGSPDEIAGTVKFFFSSESRYITGAVIDVNGGLWMG